MRNMWPKTTPAAPVMLHRAILGSLERFHRHSHRKPRWGIAAVAVSSAGGGAEYLRKAQADYVADVVKRCDRAASASRADLRNEKITL